MARDVSFFNEIKQRVPLDEYMATHLNVEFVEDGAGRLAAVCPFHQEDTPSMKVTESSEGDWKRWHCFGACQDGGSIIDAVMRAEGFGEANEAAEFLNELYDLGLDTNSEGYKRFKRTVAETRTAMDRANSTMADKDSKVAQIAKKYLHNRGFTDDTIEHFGLAVDTEHSRAGRLSIPLIDKANHPVSIANRALFDSFPCRACGDLITPKEIRKAQYQAKKAETKNEPVIHWKNCPHCGAEEKAAGVAFLARQDPKYLFLRDFDKANFMYHEWFVRKAIRDDEARGLYLVEGYADVWAGYQAGNTTICSYNGAVLSDWQAKEAIEIIEATSRVNNDGSSKPIILVPDFDPTGMHNVDVNIRKLRAENPFIEIQVVYGIDSIFYAEGEERKACKDLGDVLQHFGASKVAEVLLNNRYSAAEWQIRKIINATNQKTGETFHTKQRQFELVGEILAGIKTKEVLDHLVPDLSSHWNIPDAQVRSFFYASLSQEDTVSARHLFKDSRQAEEESRAFLNDGNVIPFGFSEIDKRFPGGGARRGQLAMILGKSGTGKAHPLETPILTPTGWKAMGLMQIGDQVVNPDGGSAEVTGVFPQAFARSIESRLMTELQLSAMLSTFGASRVTEPNFATRQFRRCLTRDSRS